MSNYEYSSSATTRNESLKERIKKAFFRFEESYEWKELNWDSGEKETYVGKREIEGFDLAVLFGIRETCYGKEGDTPLSDEEKRRLLLALGEQNALRSMVYPRKENQFFDIENLVSMFDEKRERIEEGSYQENDDGSLTIFLDYTIDTRLFRALTLAYPGSQMDVFEYRDYDDGYEYSSMETWHRFVEFGVCKELGSTFYGADSEESDLETSNEEPKESVSWREFAQKGEYEEAIEILSLSEDDPGVSNDLGVCYNRLGNFEKAYECYLRSNTELSLTNATDLYLSRFNLDFADFEKICDRLTELNSPNGYLAMSKYFRDAPNESERNPELAMEYAKKAYESFPHRPEAIFDYAHCLSAFSDSEGDKEKSQELYQSILFIGNDANHISPIARSNFALGCLHGEGCKKDVDKAIYWLIRSFEGGYGKAASHLAWIYKEEDGFKNQECLAFWEKQHEEKGDGIFDPS